MRKHKFNKGTASIVLTCLGGVGVVATTVTAVRATPKALRLIEEAEKEKGENTVTDEEPKETAEDKKGPYVIQPEQFCDCDYTPMTLWYWTDGEVTNDDKKIVANVDELIGDVDEVTSYFGEYENDPDTVYVRNDIQRIDYEILKEYRAFSDLNSDEEYDE